MGRVGSGVIALSERGSGSWPIHASKPGAESLPGINLAPLGAPWPHGVLVSFLVCCPSLQGAAQPFFQEPGQQPQKPGWGRVINPKTIMETSEPMITTDIHISDFDI